MIEYRATLAQDTYTAKLSQDSYSAGLDSAVVVNIVTAEHYQGPYEVTPGEEMQSLETSGKHMEDNVIIQPIPPNYGRILWNGSTLAVY